MEPPLVQEPQVQAVGKRLGESLQTLPKAGSVRSVRFPEEALAGGGAP
jgi:hypothetical protein